KILPPSANYRTPNPSINWITSPFYVNTEPISWTSPENDIRRAGVSSFGFGGTNYHVILEEYIPQLYGTTPSISQEAQIPDVISDSIPSAPTSSNELCFLFSGQGSQYVGMAKELYEKYQIIQNILDKANEICKDFGGFDLLELIFGSPNISEEENSKKLRQTQYTQPAIYSVEMALVNLFKSEGIKPGIVGGHSLGEFAALVTADVLNFEDGLKAVITRGKAMAESSPGVQSTMAAIFTSSEIVEETLKELSVENVSISNYNSTSQTVISGEVSAVESVVSVFSEKGTRAIKLNVSTAFHSKYVAPAEEKLKIFLESIEFNTPQIPVFSNVTGKIYPEDPEKIKSILLKQITSPVRWVEETSSIYQYGGRKFLEIGPKKALFFFTKDILKKYKEIEVNYTLSPKAPEVDHLQKIFEQYKTKSPSKEVFKSSLTPQLSRGAPTQNYLSSDNKLSEIKQLPHFTEFLEEQKEILSSVIEQGFQNYMKKYQSTLEKSYSIDRSKFKDNPIVITGVGIGLPGKNRKIFDDQNIDDILEGINLIEPISKEFETQLLQKNIIRLEKAPNGNAKFQAIDDISKVIHLAGQMGEFNPTDDYQFDDKMLNALDITFQLAICAGYEALKDAGIPLVRSNITTSTGKILSGDWALPEDLQDETGIIFASAFPGYDNFADELSYNMANKSEEEDKTFNRAFLFRVLSMGHSQFAQLIKAKGPNTSTNAACASTPQAIGIAEDWIRTGRCKRVIVITADNVTSKNLFQWIGAGFLTSGAATSKSQWEDAVLPFGEGRNGIIIGAGASAFVIEQESVAKARGVNPIVEVLGSYFANSAFHGTRLDKVHISQKLNEFVAEIVKRHGITKNELASKGMFVSHETYSPARGGSAESELLALEETFGNQAYDMMIINTKGYTGHAMGAGIEEAVAIKSMEKGKIPPIANLSRIDPNYKRFNFSKGSNKRKEYALRFAAGFGSQLAFVLFRLVSYGNRLDSIKYESWLQKMGGTMKNLFDDGRILKMKTERVKPSQITSTSLKSEETETIETNNFINEIKQIIALKTGYDPNDIEETYDLEEDLGIDTVKQAEIFGEIREKWDIEVDDSFNLADYRTINEIIQMLNEYLGADTTSSRVVLSTDTSKLEEKLVQIISEKTGYDPEDIDVNFDLEEDLGIDTVKQAEIFGEMRDYLKIPEDTEIGLAGLKSIREIIHKTHEFLYNQNSDANVTFTQERITTEMDESNEITKVNRLVKKIIAEKTGYEISDIEDSYELEEDLGIDTVKQAEIFGELRAFYKLDESIEINITEIRTPSDITQFIIQYVSKTPVLDDDILEIPRDVDDSSELLEEDGKEEIYISKVTPSRIFRLPRSENDSKLKNLETLILNINSGLENFQSLRGDFKKVGLETQVFDLTSEKITKKEFPLNNVYKILILVVPDPNQYSLNDSLPLFDNLFVIFQSLDISALEKIIVLSPEEYFGWEQGANSLSSSIGAFIKTINREFQIPIKHIYSQNLGQIIQEILIWDDIEEVAYKESVRYTLLRKKLEEFPEQHESSLTKEDVLLVTGGAQGITFVCIDELTNHVKPQLILLGLAPYDDSLHEFLDQSSEKLEEKKQEITKLLKSKQEKVTPVMIKREWKNFLDKLDTLQNIENLRKKGLEVQYYAVDVTNDEKMQETLQQIQENTEKPITTVIHGAGIEESKSFLNKNLKMAHKVVDVKVGGFLNVLKYLPLQDIKYFITFSSVAGRYGNQGQIDYAYANAFLSRLAWNCTQNKMPFLTIDWTAWADIGMATQGSTLQILTQAGVIPVPPQVGASIFTKLVLHGFKGEYIVGGKLGIFEEKLDVTETLNKTEFPMLNKMNYQPDFIIGSNSLNSEHDTYLLDHQIQQKPVFPGVMVLETFAEFYHHVFDRTLTSISNVNFHTPLKIPLNKTVEVELKYDNTNNEVAFLSKTYPLVLKGKALIKEHFNAELGKSIKKMRWKKEPISEPLIPLLDKNEIYEVFFHGPKFQVLNEIIQLENGKIIAKVDIPIKSLTRNSEGDNFQLNPLALESVFQTAALFDVIINNHLSLPSKISTLEVVSKEKPKYIVAKFLEIDEERSYFNSVILSENLDIIAKVGRLEIIHSPLSLNITERLSNYLVTLKEYYLLKNGKISNNFHILPIEKIKIKSQNDPKFLDTYLTVNEIDRSKRFRNEKRKLEYFAGILAAKECFIKHTPNKNSYSEIEVQKDDKGRPFYYSVKDNKSIPINLSISHSHEFSVAIISKNQVGIDLELIEQRSPSFYKEVFTESERDLISENDKLGTLYWTAKEAFSKAIGEGFHINFRDFELTFNEKLRKFTLKTKKDQLEYPKGFKKLKLKSEFTEKYVLSYCEL
ncbi:MAG: SDR family NAD(P)-dependent oxidoreductase, partial [Promethearchaeota archaeon]